MRIPNRLTNLTTAMLALALSATACAPDMEVDEADAVDEATEEAAEEEAYDKNACVLVLDRTRDLVRVILGAQGLNDLDKRLEALHKQGKMDLAKGDLGDGLTCAKAEGYSALVKEARERRLQTAVLLGLAVGGAALNITLGSYIDGGTVENKCSESQRRKIAGYKLTERQCSQHHRCAQAADRRVGWRHPAYTNAVKMFTMLSEFSDPNVRQMAKNHLNVLNEHLKTGATLKYLRFALNQAVEKLLAHCYDYEGIDRLFVTMAAYRDTLINPDAEAAPGA